MKTQYAGLKLKVITFNCEGVLTMSVETSPFDSDWGLTPQHNDNVWEGQS